MGPLIFVDTSFWVALRRAGDAHHTDAASLIVQLARRPLMTTNHVVGETWTFLRRRSGRGAALDFLDRVEAAERLRIMFVPERLEREAWAWLRRRDEREYSLVDATSFAVMRSFRIREALAFDGDFAAAGFVELRP